MADAAALTRRGLLLEALTLAWNGVGTGVLLATAIAAHSVALIGFGLDSMIEVLASLVVIWQLKGIPGERDHRAMRITGAAFALLAVYVLVQSARVLLDGAHPGTSALGTAWVAATVATMLLLAAGKHRTGARLGYVVLTAEARVTLIDAVGYPFDRTWASMIGLRPGRASRGGSDPQGARRRVGGPEKGLWGLPELTSGGPTWSG